MMLVVLVALLMVSPQFKRLYMKWLPELGRVAKLAFFILSAAWLTAFGGIALFGRDTFASPIFWGFFVASYIGLLDLLFSTGPALAGIHRLLGDKVQIITRVGTIVAFCAFVFFTMWAMRVPQPRGPSWSFGATGIRVAAILSGLLTLLLLLGALLPVVINLLERRTFTTFVGARHVRSKKSGFLTVISLLSILGVALSSCTLGSVVSVMGGFSADLKRKILGNNAHIVVDRESLQTFGDYEPLIEDLRATPGVLGVTPVVHGEVMIASASNLAGVLVRGIDPLTIHSVIELPEQIEVGSFEYLEHPEKLADLPPDTVIGLSPKGEPYLKGPKLDTSHDDLDPEVRAALLQSSIRSGLIVGRELAKTLHLLVGDEVTLVSPMGDLGPMGLLPRTRKFRIAAIFYSGMYEYDASHVYMTLDAANEYFLLNGKVSVLDIKVEDAERIDDETAQVTRKVGALFLDSNGDVTAQPAPADPQAGPPGKLRVRDWREINRNLFSALKLERFAAFVLLSIAIMVASFCIVCTLLLMVTEKGKEIAILKAIGATDGAILRIFMLEGVLIGAVGTAFGVATGVALCSGVKFFGLKLDPDVYYVDRLPIQMSPADFALVALASMTICVISTIYPAISASKLRPVEGLRYE